MISKAYADGGCIGANPSFDGGTWAFRLVADDGKVVKEASGYVEPSALGLESVNNSHTELLAVLMALESLPEGWAGTLFTDSQITQFRLTKENPSFGGIPEDMIEECWAQRKRMGEFKVILLDGHPTKAHLANGVGKRGYPVSAHNVACDKMCTEQAKAFLTRKNRK